MIILELLDHMALLTALVVISGFISKRWEFWRRQNLLQGVLFGMVSIIGMLRPLVLSPGLIFDGRSVIVSLCAFFWGPASAIVAGSMAAVFRLNQGGGGALTGVYVILSSAIIGVLFHYRRSQKETNISTEHLFVFGLLVHVSMLTLMMTLPGSIGSGVIQQMALPVILVYPLMTVIIGRFLWDQVSRQREQQELIESEERFRQLVEMGPDAIFVHSDYRIVYMNQAAVTLMGASSKEDLIGKSATEWTHPDTREAIRERIRLLYEEKKPVPMLETTYIRLDGSKVAVEATAAPISYKGKNGALVYVRDITERKKQEREKQKRMEYQRHQQKLESIGVLAGGVAHEINNPIMGIMNYAQLLLDDDTATDTPSSYAHEIMRESERIASIVRNLLHFSRIEKQEYDEARLDKVIHGAVTLVKSVMLKDAIAIETHIQDPLPAIWCHSQQIQQVLINLLTNARDALNEKYPVSDDLKTIRIDCRLIEQDNLPWIRISVEDHGPGVPDEISEKLFEPFFTTKPKDKGTGLGLAVSYGIIEEHQGKIHFESLPGHYTRFHVDLPVRLTQGPQENTA